MPQAKAGDKVTVHYIGTLDNGRIFDQRDEEHPLTITLGAEEVFPALEREIVGMSPGEVKNICLSSEQAYGLRLDENLLQVPREMFPVDKELQVGQKLSIELADKTQRTVRIRQFNEQEVLLDGNHDLAGCDLIFALKLVDID
jgi:peptidylprolyl isomerase